MSGKCGESVSPECYQEILDEAAVAGQELLPAKTKNRYEKVQEEFSEWRKNRKVEGANEDILLCYVSSLSTNFAPNSLWYKFQC